MTEENSFRFAEYAHPVANVGKNRRGRICLILLYVFAAILYAGIAVAITIPHLIAILPLLLWMLVYFTWGAVSYECCVRVASGEVHFLKLRGKREELLLSVRVKDIVWARPNDGRKANAVVGRHEIRDFRSDTRMGGYAALLAANGKTTLLLFDCTVAIASALRYYNKEITVDKEYLAL